MSVKPLIVSDEILQKTVDAYQGRLLEESDLTRYHYFGFMYYTDTKYIYDPRIQFTMQLDITQVYDNYLKNYKVLSDKITFASFIKWIVIKSMYNTPFNWRFMNDNWYVFNNLPMEVTMRTNQNRELASYIVYNVAQSTWDSFYQKQIEYKEGKLPFNAFGTQELPVHQLCYQMLNVHIPKMTSYNVTHRVIYAQQPFVVFSDRYEEAGKIYLPFYLSYSHATLTPEDAEIFLTKILTYGKMTPLEVEAATKFEGAPNITFEKKEPPPPAPPSSDDLPF